MRLFAAMWLPLYVAIGVSWLLAPVLAHEHYGILRLISNEEATNIGVWFRIGDIIAGGLLLLAVLYFRVLRRSSVIGWTLVTIAVLSAVDGLFPDICYVGHESCGVIATSVSLVHDAETAILAGLVAILSSIDAVKYRRVASIAFVALQLGAALLVVSGFATEQSRIMLQYAYAFSVIVWLAWYVDRYNTHIPPVASAKVVRRIVGGWVFAAAILTLVSTLSLHIHLVPHGLIQKLAHDGFNVEQHAIIASILMFYISRHILRGERPALWLVLIIVAWQLLRFSLVTPQIYAVVFYGLMFIALLYARASFDRNITQPSWSSRLQDIATVFVGVLGSLLLVFAVETAFGHGSSFSHQIDKMYDYSYQEVASHERHFNEHIEARLRLLFETLVVSLGAITLWSLFRPRSFVLTSHFTGEDMQELLNTASRSSEDYFKLWPQDAKQYFGIPSQKGLIAYRVEGSVAFMLADPIANTQAEREKLLRAFAASTRQHGRMTCALLVDEDSKTMYERAGFRTIQAGSSAVISVNDFRTETLGDKWWRWQRNRAAKSGWTYEILTPPHSHKQISELRSVSDLWLGREGRQEQGFAMGYFDVSYLQTCMVHTLRNEKGELIAFANQLPTFNSVSQATIDLMRFIPDVNGAVPSLLASIIEHIDPTIHQTFDLGFVPLARADSNVAKIVRRLTANRYAAEGLEQFKNKFRPEWRPQYLAYDGDLVDLTRIAMNLEKLMAVDSIEAGAYNSHHER